MKKEYVYKVAKDSSGNDVELKIIKYSPDGQEGPLPAIVFFFGGGWSGGDTDHFSKQAQYLAERGMVALTPEYRINGKHGTTPDLCVKDAKSAMRWVKENVEMLGIVPDMIAAGGGSVGGHLAIATAVIEGFNEEGDNLEISPKPNALVLFNPVYNNGPDNYGYDRVKDYWQDFSPMHNLTPDTPPTIVFLGTEDGLVSVETAKEFQMIMLKNGCHSDLHLYEGKEHGFFNYGRHDNSCYYDTLAKVDDFLVSLGYIPAKKD